MLYATPECAPWVKTGGLGDVASALTAQLRRDGLDVRVLMPAYRSVLGCIDRSKVLAVLAPSHAIPGATLVEALLPDGVPALLIDCPALFDRDGGPYQDERGHDFTDNAQRFALLSRTAAQLATAGCPIAWRAQVLHCNDWPTGPAPALVHHASGMRAGTLMTIHNLAFQGVFDGDLTALLGLPREAFGIDGVEYYGSTSFLKAGLVFADRLSTVSPTYAREIQSAPLGMGLEGVLAKRRKVLTGIQNGIDDTAWNPACDPALHTNYDATSIDAKSRNKTALQRELGLHVSATRPLFGVVSRLTVQKGVDLLSVLAERIVALPAQLAILGTGDRDLEHALADAARAHPGCIATTIGFDERLAHRIEAGADLFLMPSRFEPCGLNQMFSQRYGTPPVARATGGLVDSIVDATPATIAQGTATGFLFREATADGLWSALVRARDALATPAAWRAIQLAGMARPFGWAHRSPEYAALYQRVAGVRP